MARNYNLDRRPDRKKSGENAFIAAVAAATVLGMAVIFSGTQPEPAAADKETVPRETQAIVSESEVEIPATPVSMVQAGTLLADRQNMLIAENDRYLLTVRNAEADGYQGTILMTDAYQQLLEDFHKEYMKEKPAGSTGVIWSGYGVWEFNAHFDYAMEQHDSMKAVWLCYDEDDIMKKRPYAVCTATYVTASGQFVEPRLYKTEWYPKKASTVTQDMIREAGAPEDTGVSADQCGDEDAANGSNDDGIMTKEQERVREELQKQIDANASKKNAVSIGH